MAEAREGQRPGKMIFWGTKVSSFLADIGDKTELATTVLVAKFASIYPVVNGTTPGI